MIFVLYNSQLKLNLPFLSELEQIKLYRAGDSFSCILLCFISSQKVGDREEWEFYDDMWLHKSNNYIA